MALRDISPKKKKKMYKKTYLALAINQIERGGRGDSGRAALKYARFPGLGEGRREEGEKRKSKIPRRNNPWDNLDPGRKREKEWRHGNSGGTPPLVCIDLNGNP